MATLVACDNNTKSFVEALRQVAPSRELRTVDDLGEIGDITQALAWRAPAGVFARLPNLQLIVSAGAGVDHLLADRSMPPVPLVRFVDPDLTARMTSWVVFQVLHHARRMPEFRLLQTEQSWNQLQDAAARDVRVGVMGAGVLGQAALKALAPFGYDLACWSRSHQEITGVASFAGNASLPEYLARTDILVVLLPLTSDTRGILNATTFAGLSTDGRRSQYLPGPALINAGRGGLQREADILAALADGTLWSASLDVFESEPLAASSPLWTHPRVVITPHVSALSSPEAVARYFWEQVERLERREALPNRVLQDRGY